MNTVHDARTRTDAPTVLNVFLAYDTADTGRMALALFGHVASGLKDEVLLNTKVWRFDLLTLSECAQQAQADAANADLIVVAFGALEPLPADLCQWLGEWAEHRDTPDAALAALPTGAGVGEAGLPVVETLRSLASRHGLDFICGAEAVSADHLATLAPGSPRR
ncbi:MAG: hypothetical protein ABSF95_21910 [Verrucomicrobiota bacterium]|jgi:hypothetical protein